MKGQQQQHEGYSPPLPSLRSVRASSTSPSFSASSPTLHVNGRGKKARHLFEAWRESPAMEEEGNRVPANGLDGFRRAQQHDTETSRQTSALILHRLKGKLEEERRRSEERAREVEDLRKVVGEKRQQEALLRAERDIERMLVAKARVLITEADVSRALVLADYEEEVRRREKLAVKLHETEEKLSSEQDMFRRFLLLLEAEKLKSKDLSRRAEALEEALESEMEEAARLRKTISELKRSGEKQKRVFSAERRSLNKKIANIQRVGGALPLPSSPSPVLVKPAKPCRARKAADASDGLLSPAVSTPLEEGKEGERGTEQGTEGEDEEETEQLKESLSQHDEDVQEVDRTYEQLKELEELYENLQERNRRVELELELAREEGRKREDALAAEMADAKMREEALSTKLEATETRGRELEEQLVSRNQALRAEEERVQTLSSSLSSAEEQLEETKSKLSSAELQLEELNARVTELSLQASLLGKGLKEAEKKKEELASCLQSAEEETKALKKQVAWQQEEAREAEERMSKLETEIRMKEILIKVFLMPPSSPSSRSPALDLPLHLPTSFIFRPLSLYLRLYLSLLIPSSPLATLSSSSIPHWLSAQSLEIGERTELEVLVLGELNELQVG
eukprot:751365-Hanusia_phi.AAC.1